MTVKVRCESEYVHDQYEHCDQVRCLKRGFLNTEKEIVRSEIYRTV